MAEHNQRTPRRNAVVAGVFVSLLAIVVIAVLLAAPRRTPPEPPAPAEPAPAPPSTPLTPPPPLGRSDLVGAARAAAAAYAGGGDALAEEAALAGRQFRLRLPFGCLGVSPGAEPASWRYDDERGTLTLTARTVHWTGTPLARSLPEASAIEAVEGFWIPRPWLESESCPALPVPPPAAEPAADEAPPPKAPPPKARAARPAAAKAAPAPAPAPPPLPSPSPQTVGLAEVFREGGSRVFRRGERPYQVVEKAEPPTGPHVYHLVLEGRVTAAWDGRVVRCRAETADRRPVCLVTVEFDRVAFEDPAGGEVLGEWRR